MEALLKAAYEVIKQAKTTIFNQRVLITMQKSDIELKDSEIVRLKSELAYQKNLNEAIDSVLAEDKEYELHLLSEDKEKALTEFIKEIKGETNEDNHIQSA
ncbi:MAG: hypothetical protein WBL80_05645 [Erysipelotrichaceae bacterium]